MAINVNNKEADALARKFAEMEGVGLTEAIVIAMKEAIERRRRAETPIETARRLRGKYGIKLPDHAKTPLQKAVFDEMWDAG
jgi:antitoxin VapB